MRRASLLLLLAACSGSPSAGEAPVDAGSAVDQGSPIDEAHRDAGVTPPLLDAQAAPDVAPPDVAPPDVAPPDSDPPDSDPPDAGQPADAGPAASRLLEVQHIGDFARADIQAQLDPRVSIDNGYSIHRVRFRTDGREALATVAVPYQAEAPEEGWHVVVNNPGTNGVEDPCTLGFWVAGAGLAGLFGGRGAIGVQLDYPGLGTPGVHPYLVAEVEGRASLDAVRATLELATRLEVPTSGRAAIVGLSQGGHATLAAAARHRDYAPELDLRAFAAAAPSSVWLEQWSAYPHVAGSHQAFYALLTYAWQRHYGHAGAPVWAESMRDRIDGIMAEHCLLSPSMFATSLWSALGEDPRAIFHPDFIAAFRAADFGDYPFMARGFRENRVGPYPQTAPLRVYQGSADEVVLEADTRALVEALRAGGVEVDYQVVEGAGHIDLAFGYVADHEARTEESIAWVKAQLDR